jgi:hypothetical protein
MAGMFREILRTPKATIPLEALSILRVKDKSMDESAAGEAHRFALSVFSGCVFPLKKSLF